MKNNTGFRPSPEAKSPVRRKDLSKSVRHPFKKSKHIDTCPWPGYNHAMIQGFKHKGPKSLYETGSQKGVFRFENNHAVDVDYSDYH